MHTLDPLFAALSRSDTPGGVVGVAHGGRSIYRRGYGLASVQHGVANSATTRMRVGCTTKHFTARGALLLTAAGRAARSLRPSLSPAPSLLQRQLEPAQLLRSTLVARRCTTWNGRRS